MPKLQDSSPRCSVLLYKTMQRVTSTEQVPVSARYTGKDEFIDLTPFLGEGSSVRTTKSVREPSGGFTISFTDQPQRASSNNSYAPGFSPLESVYGLVEPMDVVEIRMWGGLGPAPAPAQYPIVMRGFVSEISRSQAMGEGGIPARSVTISGQDYGKIWQTYQVIYLPFYIEGKPLLTTLKFSEAFGVDAVNAQSAAGFVSEIVRKVINPHIENLLPKQPQAGIPRLIQTGDSIAVKHGVVGLHYQEAQGAIYDILKTHGDVGLWNELYVEDREDGVHCVYRPIPALKLTPGALADRKIHDDSPDPVFVSIPDGFLQSLSVSRGDSNVANFYWVNNSKYDLVADLSRKQYSLTDLNNTVSGRDYPNSDDKYYGVRPLYGETMQGEDSIAYVGGGLQKEAQEARTKKMEAWIDRRRRQLNETNKDNVVLERGTAQVKGGQMRPDGKECMKAGDYAILGSGKLRWAAYVHQIDHLFVPYQGYTSTLMFERGEGFAARIESSSLSPWLSEQASTAL